MGGNGIFLCLIKDFFMILQYKAILLPNQL